MPKQQYAAKYRIKGAKDWSNIYFWADNDEEAKQESLDYILVKAKENSATVAAGDI